MGIGITQFFAARGIRVSLADRSADEVRRSVHKLTAQVERWFEKNLVSEGERARIAQHIDVAASIDEACSEVTLAIEAVPEDLALKRDVLEQMFTATRPDALVATNTSAIPISQLAESAERPDDFLGMHWFNPAPFVPLVELIGRALPVERASRLLSKLGKTPIHVADSAGFVGNRLQFALYREAILMIEEGTSTAQQIDEVVAGSFGTRLPIIGPMAAGDLSGLDVYLGAFRSLEAQYGPRFAPPASLVRMVAQGDLGLKSGGGYRRLDPAIHHVVEDLRDAAVVAVSSVQHRFLPELAAMQSNLGRHRDEG